MSPLKHLENTYLKNEAPLFENCFTYIEILNKILEGKNTSNLSGSILDPYLLYRLGKKDVTNSLILENYPYLRNMENIYKLSSAGSLELAQVSALNIEAEIMSQIKANNKDLEGLALYQACIAYHNSKYVTIGPTFSIQPREKKMAIYHWGQNTPSPWNLEVTPLDNTAFQEQMRSIDEEWKGSWAYLAWELNVTYRALQYIKLDGKGPEAAKLKVYYDFWLARQLHIYFSHERDSIFRDNHYIKDWTLKGVNPMQRELLEDNLYVMLNLLLAKRILEKPSNISIEDCINAHYEEYSVGYNFLKALRLYNFNKYTSTVMLDRMMGGQF